MKEPRGSRARGGGVQFSPSINQLASKFGDRTFGVDNENRSTGGILAQRAELVQRVLPTMQAAIHAATNSLPVGRGSLCPLVLLFHFTLLNVTKTVSAYVSVHST